MSGPPTLPVRAVWSRDKDPSTVSAARQEGTWGRSPLTRALPQGQYRVLFLAEESTSEMLSTCARVSGGGGSRENASI